MLYEERDTVRFACPVCKITLHREFPAPRLNPVEVGFTPYYDEALDADIETPQQKKHILKAEGLIEAGDPVNGARNFDKHAPDHVKMGTPQGKKWVSPLQRQAQAQVAQKEWDVSTEQGGKWVKQEGKPIPSAKKKKKAPFV